MMPCSSKIQVPYLLKILEDGADGIEVIACPENSCKFLVGSRRVEKRIKYARGLLESISIGPEVLGITREHNLTLEHIIELVKQRAEVIKRQKGEEL
jgi:coenzyme F420-reducing hydrogenase delta subunit